MRVAVCADGGADGESIDRQSDCYTDGETKQGANHVSYHVISYHISYDVISNNVPHNDLPYDVSYDTVSHNASHNAVSHDASHHAVSHGESVDRQSDGAAKQRANHVSYNVSHNNLPYDVSHNAISHNASNVAISHNVSHNFIPNSTPYDIIPNSIPYDSISNSNTNNPPHKTTNANPHNLSVNLSNDLPALPNSNPNLLHLNLQPKRRWLHRPFLLYQQRHNNPTDDGSDGNFYCVNGGTCGGTTGSCTCVDCNTGYTGENCDTPVNCTATDNPTDDGSDGNFYCVNGGTCGGTTGTCTCTECDTGHTGDHCHLASPATPSPTPLLPPSPPTDVLDPTLPNINPSYGYSLCACKSRVYKLAVVETRDFCMAACLGGKVLSCKTLEPGEAPPADFDAYPGPVSARVTCSTYSFPPASPPGLGIVPEVTEDMKRPPTEDEFPADFDDRVELWRSTTPPDTFSWSNQTDLLSFIKNGRWVPNSPSSPPGGEQVVSS
ncbi:hypothetical protein TL16_g03949 [Triparma laevis f. inornata]|uniref:EGF-like domain-containing protein n=1 Tax=Triparma laevis f. inornata TaxID=1714386 RepID=A0A9W7E6I9_9STRA|nr:hypothetical protein TL16_g03949 [Triparma laevis f. inornata]